MRDPALLVRLLRSAAEDPAGELSVFDVPREDSELYKHHVDLLIDAEHLQWKSAPNVPSWVARMTDQGYDFLNAVDKDDTSRSKFIEIFQAGKPYIEAVLEVLKLGAKTAGG